MTAQEFSIGPEYKQFLDANYGVDVQEYLFEHSSGIGHSKRTLLEHLVNTVRILKSWDCEDYLCRAGLFHSIYGTEAFSAPPVPLDHRREVQSLIGDESEQLAYLFSAMKRELFYENLDRDSGFVIFDRFNNAEVGISEKQYLELFTIVMADWLELRPRKDAESQFYRKDDFVRASSLLPEKAVRAFRQAYGLDSLPT